MSHYRPPTHLAAGGAVTCVRCGAVVDNSDTHDQLHGFLERLREASPAFPPDDPEQPVRHYPGTVLVIECDAGVLSRIPVDQLAPLAHLYPGGQLPIVGPTPAGPDDAMVLVGRPDVRVRVEVDQDEPEYRLSGDDSRALLIRVQAAEAARDAHARAAVEAEDALNQLRNAVLAAHDPEATDAGERLYSLADRVQRGEL